MIAFFAANGLTMLVLAVVTGLVALCLRNILPRKGQAPGCAGCDRCGGGSCSACSGSCGKAV